MSTENKFQFKGTQGEWHVSGRGYHVRVGTKPPHAQSFTLSVGLNTDGTMKDDPKGKANAHLIAAAPELLQACIETMKVCDLAMDLTFVPVYKMMQAAVDKALNIK